MCVVLSPPGWFCCQGNWGCTLSALPGGWWSAGSFDLMTPAGRCTAEGNNKRERKKKWKWVRVKQRDELGLAYYFSLPWGELPSISQEPVCSDTPQVPCSSCNLATITMDTCCLSAPAQQGVKELGGNAMPPTHLHHQGHLEHCTIVLIQVKRPKHLTKCQRARKWVIDS